MTIINVMVDDQRLEFSSMPVVASEGVKETYVKFALSSDWSGFGATALFYRDDSPDDVYTSVLDGAGLAEVPYEITAAPGWIRFGLSGSDGTSVHTSEILKYKVVKGKYTSGQSSEPPAPGIYEQMLAIAGQMRDTLNASVIEQNAIIQGLVTDMDDLRSDMETEQTTFESVVTGQINTLVNNFAGSSRETVLFEGSHTVNIGDEIDLVSDPTVYDYLDIVLNDGMVGTIIGPTQNSQWRVTGETVKSTGASVTTYVIEGVLDAQSLCLRVSTACAIVDTGTVSTRYDLGSGPIADESLRRYCLKVIGRKLTDDAEVLNIRVGADGVTYQTAGTAVRSQLDKKLNAPISGGTVDYGTSGQLLATDGQGNTEWVDSVIPDGSITVAKLAPGVIDTTYLIQGAAAESVTVGQSLASKASAADVTALGTRVTAAEGDLTQLQLGNLPKTIIKNSYVTVTGEIIAYNGWDRTEYIPVNKYYSIVAKFSVSSAYNVFFDENFDKIGSNFTVGTTDTTVLVPTGAKYVVFSNTAAGMQNLETHYITKTENTATGVKNAYFLDQEGKLPYYIVNNERITNLGVVETKPGWDRTEYIPVSKYKKLVAKSSASSPYNVFYAEDKVTKVGNAITVGTTDTEISIPSGAHYIIFSNTAAGMQDFECVYTLKNIYMNDINQGLAVVMPPIDETINYNTDTKTLSIPSGTSVYFGTNLRNVTATDLSITVSNRVRINYDYVNDTFSATAFNVPTPENNVLFAILRRDTYGKKVSMAINAPYTIDGVPYGVKPPSERYVPEYYKTYIQGKAVEINELESGLNGDSFIFLTDYHRQSNKKNSPSLVKYLMENTGARFVMFGGDAQDYEETLDDAVKETMGFKEDFASERDCLFCAIGNHEFNYHYHNLDPEQYPASIKMTYNQIYSLLLKQNEHLFGALNSYGDYWFDNAVQKIRYFVIGCDEGSGISSIQFVWFLEQLLLVPNGYTVFVFSHATFKQKGDIIAGRTHIYVYDYVEKMANALEALGNSQAYTFNNVVYDFSNKDVTRGIIIGGHTHFDANTQDYEYLVNYSDQSISWDITPIICVTTDAISRYRTDTEIITRTAGTTSEQAFDYVRIDKTNKTVTFKRIGAGSDRVISY